MNFMIDCDKNYIYQTATLIYSISKNTPKNENNVFLFTQYQDRQLKSKDLNKLKKKIRINDTFKIINVENLNINKKNGRWNSQVLLRLIAPFYLKNINYVLHIDSDVIVNDDIKQFYYSFPKSLSLYGTKETMPWVKEKINNLHIKDNLYLNAGVLLIDINKYKEKIKSLSNLKLLIDNSNLSDAIDQDLLNIVFDNQKAFYKDDTYMHFCAPYHTVDINYQSIKPIIFHYAGFHRPWSYKGFVNHRLLYFRYAVHAFPFFCVLKLFILRICWLLIYPIRKVFKNA